MPITVKNNIVLSFPLAEKGVNLHANVSKMDPTECLISQNLVWKNGMVKIGGAEKFTTEKVSTGNKISGVYRYLKSDGNIQVMTASGLTVKYYDGTNWQNIRTVSTEASNTIFVNWIGSVYIADNANSPHKWDGTTDTILTAFPSDTIQMLPYRDRLLIISTSNPGDLQWSGSYDDTTIETVNSTGVRPDTFLNGMVLHASNNTNSGLDAKILLAGTNGMYLFSGTDLRTPSTTGNYRLDKLPLEVGCNAVKTMVSTPFGTLWLGMDKEVYLLLFNSSTPIPVGTKLISTWRGQLGIESIPDSRIKDACATYHDGFYKLSVSSKSATMNDTQWWLDLRRLNKDKSNLFGPWYGPMTGINISSYNNVTAGGGLELLAGSDSNDSIVYLVNQTGVFSNVNSNIETIFMTPYNLINNEGLENYIRRVELELLDVIGDIFISLEDLQKQLASNNDIGGGSKYYGEEDYGLIDYNSSAIYLGKNTVFYSDTEDIYYGEEFYNDRIPTYKIVTFPDFISYKHLSIVIKHSSNIDTFELYNIKPEQQEQSLFGGLS